MYVTLIEDEEAPGQVIAHHATRTYRLSQTYYAEKDTVARLVRLYGRRVVAVLPHELAPSEMKWRAVAAISSDRGKGVEQLHRRAMVSLGGNWKRPETVAAIIKAYYNGEGQTGPAFGFIMEDIREALAVDIGPAPAEEGAGETRSLAASEEDGEGVETIIDDKRLASKLAEAGIVTVAQLRAAHESGQAIPGVGKAAAKKIAEALNEDR